MANELGVYAVRVRTHIYFRAESSFICRIHLIATFSILCMCQSHFEGSMINSIGHPGLDVIFCISLDL